jgi:CheY-like chemotaxis protein
MPLPPTPRRRATGPLSGLTILAVEDSRFASEALRLLSLRSNARLRRAETLRQAERHLSVYRPDVVIVDLGLPDGNGADLIRQLTGGRSPGTVVLGTSGDPQGEERATAAGAVGFLPKPPESLAAFQAAILGPLRASAVAADTSRVAPDHIALQDDLRRAADLLREATDAHRRRYAASFVRSVARSAEDADLARAAGHAADTPLALPHLMALVSARLAAAPAAFAPLPRNAAQ